MLLFLYTQGIAYTFFSYFGYFAYLTQGSRKQTELLPNVGHKLCTSKVI